MKNIIILGSTGSIGTQTLEIVSEFPEKFNVIGLSAGKNIELLEQQIQQFQPDYVNVQNSEDIPKLQQKIGNNITFSYGEEGLVDLAKCSVDLLIVAIVGTASLKPTAAAIRQGTTIGLACKEVLVSAGEFIMPLARQHNVDILPVDSEHAAIKQCLAGISEDTTQIHKLILTASGGPFLDTPQDQFSTIMPEDALKHPNWTMGAKITIDSATLMNKGLEVMEAHHLFNVPYSQIDVLVHPKSIVHSLVEFSDGTLLSQMGLPDMRFPIQYVMSYPEKWENPWPKTDLSSLGSLNFYKPNKNKFPLLQLAFDVGEQGGTSPAILNAANEIAVQLFLEKKISFLDIHRVIEQALSKFSTTPAPTLDDIIALDFEVKNSTLHDHS